MFCRKTEFFAKQQVTLTLAKINNFMVNIFLRAMSPKHFDSYSCFFLEMGESPFLGKDRHK